MNESLKAELRRAISEGRVVPVVGAGVSTAAGGLPGWKGVIEDGLRHVESLDWTDRSELSTARADLARNDFVRAAHKLKDLLGAPGGEYTLWLKNLFGLKRSQIRSHALINKLVDLPCSLIATTNYDRLLQQLHFDSPECVTWQQPPRMHVALREGGCILHLHGIYDQPESVVFGLDNYQELTANPSYAAVLRALWLERVLFFVGCSLDGLKDPDFKKLLDWASHTFGTSPFKHYAFLKRGSFSPEEAASFLQQYRIHTVDFGPDFADLPRAIDDINPQRDRAYARRLLRAREIAATPDPTNMPVVEDWLRGAARTELQDTDINVTEVAEQLFVGKQRDASKMRGDLAAMQRLVSSMISQVDLMNEIARWESGLIKTYDGSFRESVVRASGGLFLFSDEMLAALKRRGVDIHEAHLSGYCRQNLEDLERLSDLGISDSNAYSIENAKRILATLHEILVVDPATVFPELERGSALASDAGSFLVVVWRDRVELRNPHRPSEVIAALPSELRIKGNEVVQFGGQPVIVAFTSERVFAWDPRRSNVASAEMSVTEAYGICSASHYRTGNQLRTVLATISGPMYEFYDFGPANRWRPLERGDFLSEVVLVDNNRLFALKSGQFCLIEIQPNQDVRITLQSDDLDRLIPSIPGNATRWKARRKADAEARRQSGVSIDWSRDGDRYQHPHLGSSTLNGKRVLTLRVSIRQMCGEDTAILLLEPQGPTVQLIGGYYCVCERPTDFVLVNTDDGTLLLVTVLLSDFKLTYDLITWARGVYTAEGLCFIPEGSTLRTRDDLIAVTINRDAEGYAADNSGGLFAFSCNARSSREIERGSESRVQALHFIDFFGKALG